MEIPKELKTAVFFFINLFSLANYAILGGNITGNTDKKATLQIFSSETLNIIYLCLIVFIGIRIFAFFVGRDLNDLFLHRSLNPDGTHTKLRVLSVLIVAEILFFGTYLAYVLYPFNFEFSSITLMFCISFLLDAWNLLIIYSIHPDLYGSKHRKSVNDYCDRMSLERRVLVDVE